MRRIFLAAFLVPAGSTGVLSAGYPQQCETEVVRNLCVRSCASACEDADFLNENPSFCVTNGLIENNLDLESLADAESCAEIMGASLSEASPEVEPSTTPATEDDLGNQDQANQEPASGDDLELRLENCRDAGDIIEQRRCRKKVKAPG